MYIEVEERKIEDQSKISDKSILVISEDERGGNTLLPVHESSNSSVFLGE